MNKRNFVLSKAIIVQTLILALIWYLLAGYAAWSWWVGVPAIVCSLIVSHYLPAIPSFRLKLSRLFLFIGFFLQQSIIGGIDVALRAMHPRCPIDPGFIHYPLSIDNEFARVFFTNSISLLPGTLSVCLEDRSILVHVLDLKSSNQKNLYTLEKQVAALFGEEM